MKKMKKFMALALSAAMVMGMSMTSMASELPSGGTVDVDAPIYAFDVTNVVVPTNYVVAFNPGELKVKKDAAATAETSQIISNSYGILNKSYKDKIITVSLKVEDANKKVVFGDADSVTDAAGTSTYAINLQLIPADATEVKVGASAAATKDTASSDLNNVTMTKATGAAIDLEAGENEVSFFLKAATYDGTVDMTAENPLSSIEITGLAEGGKSITGFTFGGTMNKTADWTALTGAIKITAVYDSETSTLTSDPTAVSGTGAVYNDTAIFKRGAAVGSIKYDTDKVKSIKSVSILGTNGSLYDGYSTATDKDGVITLASTFIKPYADRLPNETTREVTIVYVGDDDQEATATVRVKLR